MNKNVLIIKSADFSAMKVKTIPLVDVYDYGFNDLLYKDKKLQVGTSTSFIENSTNYGGFIDVSQFRGCSAIIKNPNSVGYYSAIKNVSSFANNGTFAFADGFSSAVIMGENAQVQITIPSDADYLYVLCHNAGGDRAVEVEITREIN